MRAAVSMRCSVAHSPVPLAIRAPATRLGVAPGRGAEGDVPVVPLRHAEELAYRVAPVDRPVRVDFHLQYLPLPELPEEPPEAVVGAGGEESNHDLRGDR